MEKMLKTIGLVLLLLTSCGKDDSKIVVTAITTAMLPHLLNKKQLLSLHIAKTMVMQVIA